MKVRGVIPLLAIAMMASGGVHPTADRHGAVTPTVGPAPSSLHSVPDDSPHPVLRQTASGQWTTTVLLTDVLPACYYLAAWRTVTRPGTPSTLLSLQVGLRRTTRLWDLVAEAGSGTLSVPDLTAQVTQVAAAASVTGDSTTASFASASSCEVTLTFARLPQVPETASLVFNDAGASFAIPLTVNRYVSFWDYLAIPALAGFISVLCLALLLILMLMRVPDLDDRRPGPLRDPDPDDKRPQPSIRLPRFWERPVSASSAWTIRDSWATNITSGILVVGIILASTTATGSLFPGVTLNRFVLVDIVAGGIVLAAPAIFGILHAWLDGILLFRFRLTKDRTIGPSEGNDIITASLATVLITAAVTMFGIGVEIGTAIILVGLSEVNLAGRIVITSGIALAAVLLLWYSVTTIVVLVSPRPGSALASPPDTSFTL